LATDGKGSGLIAARRGRAFCPWWHLDVSLLPPLACGGGVIDWRREPGLGRIRHSRLSAKVARWVIRNASRARTHPARCPAVDIRATRRGDEIGFEA
jgi:hypothetical protein